MPAQQAYVWVLPDKTLTFHAESPTEARTRALLWLAAHAVRGGQPDDIDRLILWITRVDPTVCAQATHD